jgi:hypothetical protein
MRLLGRIRQLLSDTTGRDRTSDPEVVGAVRDARSHIRTNRQILKEIRAMQVQLERTSQH